MGNTPAGRTRYHRGVPTPLELDPEAADELARLWDTEPDTARRVEDVLDRIEANLGAADVRRRLLRPPGLWMLTVRRHTGLDVVILWDLDGDVPVVRVLRDDFT